MSDKEIKVDKLNRTEFVHFMENLILNSEQYKRDNDCKSYVIALDSAWGTGKTYFLTLLNQELKDSEDIYLINYNAWKNDYCDNAFNPLLYDILNSEHLKFSLDPIAEKENTAIFLKNTLKIVATFGKKTLENKLGITIDEVKGICETASNDIRNLFLNNIPELEELNQQREAFDNFKSYLSAATNWIKESHGKLVIVIDELDRCKPTFAIQTLEIVKHIFDIDNIVFLFAIDIKQLSHSISSVYGQGFDSTGYLCRFFDYIAKMPIPDIKPYIAERIKVIKNIPCEKHYSYKKKDYALWNEILTDFFYDVYISFAFSVRDLDTVIQSYTIMLNNFLSDYDMIEAHMLYVFCIAIKYKTPKLFEEIFIESYEKGEALRLYKEIEKIVLGRFDNVQSIKCMISQLVKDQTLQYTAGKPFCNSKGESSWSTCRLDRTKDGTAYFTNQGLYPDRNTSTRPIDEFRGRSMENILFYPDIIRWEEIKHRTLREHIHKQLEMFNFVEVSTEEE